MYTYSLIVIADSEEDAIKKASKYAGRYGDHNVSSCISYASESKLFEDTVQELISLYKGLYNASENMIKRFEGKVPEDDFIFNTLKENLERYERGSYAYPEEWKLVFHDGRDFEHIDDYSFFENIKNNTNHENLYLLIIDIP
ncbi:hypothetical protein XO10_09350 [Marinitoga sp. 1135]|uniref:Uncharacterized protein n=1 Tax=Marinitoga piezophila (strain DSM 14283 / JCM 11233 / KA3) TaxID=443254 RepID=H2J6C5_MARPK|nr:MULTISPECIES: hypothetical protein [Marinitoga]AEX86273.1 hypothetical protein Marpi_1893 [Marinitoga piezophila KA3]APT76680.1 hypothetical protein LN42_10040 [Marinitoga sp. 1137]NUU96449.1 hypothetical protein [Marinitoga sp. 1135]NUU98370.1 hypothetical protein [Marinitoga sp. 1138]